MAAPYTARIGAPGHGLLEFVAKVKVRSPSAKVRLELPGEIVRFGRSDLLSIIPAAVIAYDKHRVLVSLTEEERADTDAALAEVRLGRTRPTAFSLRVDATGLTFADLVEAAVYRGRITGEVLLRVAVEAPGRRPVVSPPFRGMLVGGDHGPGGEDSEGFHLFACHSHWHAVLPFPPLYRYTYCHGSCAGSQTCTCNKGKTVCEGWCWCTCN